jgi:hypothetical protein
VVVALEVIHAPFDPTDRLPSQIKLSRWNVIKVAAMQTDFFWDTVRVFV